MLGFSEALERLVAEQASRALEQTLPAGSSKRPRRSLAPSAAYNYLNGVPDSYVKRCDVLLKLDDGSELRVHSGTLARFSNVCASMSDDDGPLSSASASEMAHLPLSDCSRATALGLVSELYSPQQYDYLKKNMDSEFCMAIASLAHKLDMAEIVEVCGDAITHARGSQGMTPALLMKESLETFKHLMSSALQLGMKVVVACCEACIACDKTGKYKEMFKIIPPDSTIRIVGSLQYSTDHPNEHWGPKGFLERM